MKNKEKLVEVYKASTPMEAQVIKGLLESFNIQSYLKSNASPSVLTFTLNGMGEVAVMVLESMAEKARELIRTDKPGQNDEPEE